MLHFKDVALFGFQHVFFLLEHAKRIMGPCPSVRKCVVLDKYPHLQLFSLDTKS